MESQELVTVSTQSRRGNKLYRRICRLSRYEERSRLAKKEPDWRKEWAAEQREIKLDQDVEDLENAQLWKEHKTSEVEIALKALRDLQEADEEQQRMYDDYLELEAESSYFDDRDYDYSRDIDDVVPSVRRQRVPKFTRATGADDETE